MSYSPRYTRKQKFRHPSPNDKLCWSEHDLKFNTTSSSNPRACLLPEELLSKKAISCFSTDSNTWLWMAVCTRLMVMLYMRSHTNSNTALWRQKQRVIKMTHVISLRDFFNPLRTNWCLLNVQLYLMTVKIDMILMALAKASGSSSFTIQSVILPV